MDGFSVEKKKRWGVARERNNGIASVRGRQCGISMVGLLAADLAHHDDRIWGTFRVSPSDF
jgi:hypothetical protein